MPTISDLAVSISEMSEENLFNFIRALRDNRRKSLSTIPTKKKSSTSNTPTSLNIDSVINSMSETDRENLLQILEGKLNE